jgi:hypothetical protein
MAKRLEGNMRNNAGWGNSFDVKQSKAPTAREAYHTIILRRKWLDDWRGIYGGILEEEA